MRLVHPTGAQHDVHTGRQMTPDGLHLHLGGYGRKVNPAPPGRGVVYHQPTALMYIFCDLFVGVHHQEPKANLAWPEPLQPRHHVPTPVWLVTTDDQFAKAMEHAPLSDEWGVVLVGAGRPVPRGLRRNPAVIVASRVPHDQHMACHNLHDLGVAAGALDGTPVLGKYLYQGRGPIPRPPNPQCKQHAGPWREPAGPQPPRHPVAAHATQRGMVEAQQILLEPGGLAPNVCRRLGRGEARRQTTEVALPAIISRTWAVALRGTIPVAEGVAASLPLPCGSEKP